MLLYPERLKLVAFTVTTTGAVVIHPTLSADKIYVPAPTVVASPTKVVPSDSK